MDPRPDGNMVTAPCSAEPPGSAASAELERATAAEATRADAGRDACRVRPCLGLHAAMQHPSRESRQPPRPPHLSGATSGEGGGEKKKRKENKGRKRKRK